MNFLLISFFLDLVVAYWLLSVICVKLRNNETFLHMTRYGARQVRCHAFPGVASKKTFATKAGEASPKTSETHRKVRIHARRRERFHRYVHLCVHRFLRSVNASFLGRYSFSRRSSFAAFYLCGIVTCCLLLRSYPQTPCKAVAEQGIRSSLLPSLRNSTQTVSGNTWGSLGKTSEYHQKITQKVREEKFRKELQSSYRRYARLRHSPFLDVHNVTLVAILQTEYEKEVKLCEAFIAPLGWWERVPLVLFLLHCVIRLLETFLVQQYVQERQSQVTLFALLAGCSFYVMAAISLDTASVAALRRDVVSAELKNLGVLTDWTKDMTAEGSVSRFSTFLAKKKGSRNALEKRFGGLLGLLTAIVRMGPWFLPRMVLLFLVSSYIAVQGVQSYHHDLLASLRRGPQARRRYTDQEEVKKAIIKAYEASKKSAIGDLVTHKNDDGDVQQLKKNQLSLTESSATPPTPMGSAVVDPSSTVNLSDAVYDSGVWHYRFPFKAGAFTFILEPHYLCEIVLYAIQLVSMGVILLYASLPPGARMQEALCLPWFIQMWTGMWVPSPALGSALLSQVAAVVGLLLFTVLNLAQTAMEHRSFWEQLNAKRLRVKAFLVERVLLEDDLEDQFSLPDQHWDFSEDEEGPRPPVPLEKKQKGLFLERQVRRRRFHRKLMAATDPEKLPECNLVPMVW